MEHHQTSATRATGWLTIMLFDCFSEFQTSQETTTKKKTGKSGSKRKLFLQTTGINASKGLYKNIYVHTMYCYDSVIQLC